MEEKVEIIKTDTDSKNGQTKCLKCGSTDISLNSNNGKLRCNYCRFEFEPIKINNLETDLNKLSGKTICGGATDIIRGAKDIMTLKCTSCGSEVVIDTNSSTSARCHWCRNTLSINQQIPNGVIPDALLPFRISKEVAKEQIESFVGKRKFYAHPKFKEEFSTENIMGVYFPYMLIDLNTHANLFGTGEHLVRKYTQNEGNNETTYYDADLYEIEREFDLTIKGLSIESNKDRRNTESMNKTNYVINAIMPFDIENCVKYDSNYLKGYTSEKRDTIVEELKDIVKTQTDDIVRHSANTTLKEYDRGVAWIKEDISIKGEQWSSAYLPVWLYSYLEKDGDKKVMHYVAVNARTKETIGSIPLHLPKLLLVSLLIELVSMLSLIFFDFPWNFLCMLSGFIYFFYIYLKYRNFDARHKYETDTNTNLSNLRKVDKLIGRKTGLTSSRMEGANNMKVNGATSSSKILNVINEVPIINELKNKRK